MTAAEFLVRCLENEGVEYIFGLPGEQILPIMEALRCSKINFVLARHEQGASFMADVYGRLSGRPGVCLGTLGPGATNFTTGISDAFLDKVPLVAIVGQAPLSVLMKEYHQAIDIENLFRPITKWVTVVDRAEAFVIAAAVRKAFKVAKTEKPGPTVIVIPEDVAPLKVVPCEPLSTKRARRSSPDRQSLDEAAGLIRTSKFPVILAGNGVQRENALRASEELTKFAELCDIPVVTTFMGKGSISARSYMYVPYPLGFEGPSPVDPIVERADLVIAAGYDLAEFAPENWNPKRNKKIIHIDFTPAEIDSYYQPQVEVVSDIREALELLAERSKGYKTGEEVRREVERLREEFGRRWSECSEDVRYPMRPERVISELRGILGGDDVLICDVGLHKFWIAEFYPVYRPNTLVIFNGFAPMGGALPGAIGAKLAFPDRKVLAACGDGGFLMNSQELETAARLKLPIVVLVFVDSGLGLIEVKQRRQFGHPFGVNFGPLDYVEYARSLGADGHYVRGPDELKVALQEAFESDRPYVIAVPVDYGDGLETD